MQIRIHRTHKWELAVPLNQVRYGGRNPRKLVSKDTLQFLDESTNEWKDIPVVEEPAPPHPDELRHRRFGGKEPGDDLAQIIDAASQQR